jgi:hypothetical protein
MPTVKLQGGKVVTQNGKVSCSCCLVFCCLYPAAGYVNGQVTFDDLKDSILLPFSREGAKTTSIPDLGLPGYYNDVFVGDFAYAINTASEPPVWQTYERMGDPGEPQETWYWEPVETFSNGGCFFADDVFPDPVQVTYNSVAFLEDGYLNRLEFGSCQWVNTSPPYDATKWSAALRYGNTADPYKWSVTIFEPVDGAYVKRSVFYKQGAQNTLLGTYSNGSETLEVSDPYA